MTDNAYRISQIAEQEVWDNFQDETSPQTMLQTWEWGQHYESIGSKVWRLGVMHGHTLVGTALIVKVEAKRGKFLLCPHGPIIAKSHTSQTSCILKAITEHCKRLAKNEKCSFLRFCTMLEDNESNQKLFTDLGFRRAPIHTQVELTLLLDITEPEEKLLQNMRQTTRYTIHRSEKEGLEIITSSDPKDIKIFWPIYKATADRQHFTAFKRKDIEEEFSLFAKNGKALFFFAKYQGKFIAASIIIFSKQSAFYHHSGSINQPSKINSSYLIQWRAIQEAKRRGCKYYNFWGISPDDKPNHPWAGLSQFKKGFGGFQERYLPAQDKPLSPGYLPNWVIESIRRKKRGF